MAIEKESNENLSGLKGLFQDLLIIFISAGIIYFTLAVRAGNITPPGFVAPTMKPLEEIYDVLAGAYDSSGASPNSNGSITQILKCITTKINGGVCS